jgi:uncharacterized protein
MDKPWYHTEKLHFSCTQCGKCCTGSPGYVWVTEKEIEVIARHLNLTPKEVVMRYTRRVGHRLSLVERKSDYSCIFLKDDQCTLYDARPTQCRTYPFWPSIMKSKENWEKEKSFCEGMRGDEKEVSVETIEKNLRPHLF